MQRFIRVMLSRLGRLYIPLLVRFSPKFLKERLLARIILKLHSVEKGLSIQEPKLGFGIMPISTLFESIRAYHGNNFDMSAKPILMAHDAIAEYLELHKKHNFSNDFIKKVSKDQEWLGALIPQHTEKLGGTIKFKTSEMNFDLDSVRTLFATRHSARDFSGLKVDDDSIKNAVELAMRAPSACNRQAVRVYVIGKSQHSLLVDYLQGVGGFEHTVDKFLLITGKTSSYSSREKYQYIVSSAIFAAYLSLSLHAFGIGSCMFQRPVQYQVQWGRVARKMNIPLNEQIVCMIGLGMLKDEYKIPVSARLNLDDVVTFIN